jgi:hypothetical protein
MSLREPVCVMTGKFSFSAADNAGISANNGSKVNNLPMCDGIACRGQHAPDIGKIAETDDPRKILARQKERAWKSGRNRMALT